MAVEIIKEVIDAFHVWADMDIVYPGAHLKENLVLALVPLRKLQLPLHTHPLSLSIIPPHQHILQEFLSRHHPDCIAI